MNNLNSMESTHTINILNMNKRFCKSNFTHNSENLSPNINCELNKNGRRFRQYTNKSAVTNYNNNNNNNQLIENNYQHLPLIIDDSITNNSTASSSLSKYTPELTKHPLRRDLSETIDSSTVIKKTKAAKEAVYMIIKRILTNIPHALQVATVFQRAQSELQENAIKTYVQYEINEFIESFNFEESTNLLIVNGAVQYYNETYEQFAARQKRLKFYQDRRKKKKLNEHILKKKCQSYCFFNKQLTMEYKRVRSKIFTQLQLINEMGYDLSKLPIPAEYSHHYVLD